MQERLAPKGHHGLDLVLQRDLPHRIGGNLGIDPRAARGVRPLGAMLTPPRAGVGHHKFYFVQIFQVGIHSFRHLCFYCTSKRPVCQAVLRLSGEKTKTAKNHADGAEKQLQFQYRYA
jgi:hypothetical protein